MKKQTVDFINQNEETSLVYINPRNTNEKYPSTSILNQPFINKEANIGWSSDFETNPVIKSPIQVVDRGKEIQFKDQFLFSDTNKIR